jgi:hypothetical protein
MSSLLCCDITVGDPWILVGETSYKHYSAIRIQQRACISRNIMYLLEGCATPEQRSVVLFVGKMTHCKGYP